LYFTAAHQIAIPSQLSVKDTFALVLNKVVALFLLRSQNSSLGLWEVLFLQASSHSFEPSQKNIKALLPPPLRFRRVFRCLEKSSFTFAFGNRQYNRQSYIAIALLRYSILFIFENF
jgi:hypothetical protein